MGARLSSLFLYDYETQELVLASHNHPRPLPERISLKAHHRSVMDRALTERKPVTIDGFQRYEKLHKIRLERHPSPRKLNPDVPRELDRILSRCMQKVPRDRFR